MFENVKVLLGHSSLFSPEDIQNLHGMDEKEALEKVEEIYNSCKEKYGHSFVPYEIIDLKTFELADDENMKIQSYEIDDYIFTFVKSN